jgi:hypothetical protein
MTRDPEHKKETYSWAPRAEVEYGPWAAVADDARFLSALSNRWIHLVGKSMMTTTELALRKMVQEALTRRNPSPKGKLVSYFELDKFKTKNCPTCLINTQTKGFWFYPDIKLIITSQCHTDTDGGGRPMVFGNAVDRKIAATGGIACIQCYITQWGNTRQIPGDIDAAAAIRILATKSPSAIVYNKGLHLVAGLNSTKELKRIKKNQKEEFMAFNEHMQTSLLLWKSTASTQFYSRKLHRAWMCRTPARISCLNELTYTAMREASSGSTPWKVVDMSTLGWMRTDATYDNRHYRCGDTWFELARQVAAQLLAHGRAESAEFLKMLAEVGRPKN